MIRPWLVAVAAGLVVGLLATALAVLGLALAIALIVGAVRSEPRLASVGGTLIGLGYGSAAPLIRAVTSCDAATCQGPEVRLFIGLAVSALVAGVALSVIAWRLVGDPS